MRLFPPNKHFIEKKQETQNTIKIKQQMVLLYILSHNHKGKNPKQATKTVIAGSD